MALCALLSLVVFLAFLILMTYSDRLLAVLLSNDGDGSGGLVQWVKHRAALRRPAPRWDGQPAGVPVES